MKRKQEKIRRQKMENKTTNVYFTTSVASSTTPQTAKFRSIIKEINIDIDAIIEKHELSNSRNDGFADGLRYAKELLNSKIVK